jgi:hypothetical protein
MKWRIKHIFNFPPDKPWAQGYVYFGFHGRSGAQYLLQYDEHWLGCLTAEDEWLWTAGAVDKGLSRVHVPFHIKHPHYITELPDGSLLVSSNGTNQIFRIRPEQRAAQLFADTGRLGFRDIGNCVYDGLGSVWAHEIEGCRVWQLDLDGRPLRALGSGEPGFQAETVPFAAARFHWIYDLRLGPDGDLYVLDSRNYCVRRIEVGRGTVSLVAGTGRPGPAVEGISALQAAFGSDSSARFDGPFSLALDEAGNVFIGDTYNHVVRMVDRATGRISTIAGKVAAEPGVRNDPAETDPLRLNLPKICSMDYHGGCLFIPDWSDDLIVLEKEEDESKMTLGGKYE